MTGWLRKAAALILPWPGRDERVAAIQAARREKERSRAGAQHAADVAAQIRQMAEQNHFAARIAEQVMQQRHQGS